MDSGRIDTMNNLISIEKSIGLLYGCASMMQTKLNWKNLSEVT